MMRRVYYMLVLACLALVLFNTGSANAQSTNRRGEPNNLSAGYYAVASDDNVAKPWRPDYFFVDTNYQPYTWNRVRTGPRQFARPGEFFYNPTQSMWVNLNTMDTTNEAMAGPFPIGFLFNYYGIDYDSVYFSSNGFIGFRRYNEATATNAPAYTRGGIQKSGVSSPPVDLLNNYSSAPPAIIAALWADLAFHPTLDTSKVYYRTSPTFDSFFVNYYEVALQPTSGSTTTKNVTGNGSDRIFVSKMQIVITRVDSSIQINYGAFKGFAANGPTIVQARELFQRNATIGLVNETRTQSTSVLYGPGSGQGRWDAVNVKCKVCNKNLNDQYAVKFKRWHNIVRAITVDAPPRNFEICLGTATTPKATYANVDSLKQSFRVRFQIRNVVTGIATYGRIVNLVDMTPGEKRQVTTFTPYTTNPNILSQLGTFDATAIATPYDTNDVYIGDQWPFDDTVSQRIFGIRRTTVPFYDGSNNYSITLSADIPDQQKWVSIGAEVTDGEQNTWDPPPPRDFDGAGFGGHSYRSPVIFMNRRDLDGNTYAGGGVGDTLVSFPLNLQGQKNAGLSFDYFRDSRAASIPWHFDASTLFGPEHYVSIPPTGSRPADSMILEILNPYTLAGTLRANGCNPEAQSWMYITGIPGEHDFEWKKYFLKIEDLLPSPIQPNGKNYFTADFRFRLRLKASDQSVPPQNIFDDDDPWYLDNLSLQVPRKPDIEVMWTRVVTNYTKMPASQAVSLPVYVKVANNSADVIVAFPLKVQIFDPAGNIVYDQTQTITSLTGGTDSVVKMPNWNAQNANVAGGQQFTIHAWLDQQGYDTYQDDNGTYTLFNLNIDQNPDGYQEFAYDDAGLQGIPGAGNDITAAFKLPQTSQGEGIKDGSGSFAEKFRLVTKDTIYGVRVYFGRANQSDDPIRISLYNGTPNGCVPADTVAIEGVQSTFSARRMGNGFDQWWPYYFPKPIVLPGGNDAPVTKGWYWMSVSQLSLDNMVMGGDISKSSGLVRVADPLNPTMTPVFRSPYGTQALQTTNNGDVSCVWAMEITAGSNTWYNWFPSGGWWPTQANAALPVAWAPGGWGPAPAYNNIGTFAPMIRPLVSKSIMLPVEMLYLNGEYKDGAALLTWATAKEVNNSGFFIERVNANVSDAMWEKVGFVPSKVTNSNTSTGYAYRDNNVTPGEYKYRLIQTDLNGTQTVSSTVNVTVTAPQLYSLEQNYPNPFNPSTEITFTIPVGGETRVDVYNSLGQVVNTITNQSYEAGTYTVQFNGKDMNGNVLPSGTYMYKITSGQFTATRKMTLTK